MKYGKGLKERILWLLTDLCQQHKWYRIHSFESMQDLIISNGTLLPLISTEHSGGEICLQMLEISR